MPDNKDATKERATPAPILLEEVALEHIETTLNDEKKTSSELAGLGSAVETEQLYTTEIIGKNTKRTDILARFSTPELQAQTITQIEQSGNTELQAQLAALMSGGLGFTLIGRLRKGVIDMSKHDLTSAPFPEAKVAEIMKKAEDLGIDKITTVAQLTSIATTMGIDLGPQQVFLNFLQLDTPLSKELASVYLPKIAKKMHACMHSFLSSYTPGEKKVSTKGSLQQLVYTKNDFKRKNSDGTRNTENIKSFAGKTMVVGGAVGLFVKGWKWLFGSKKNKDKKKGRFARTMNGMRNMLMIGGGATVGHRLITGEWWRGTDGVVDNGTPGSLPGKKEAEDFTKEFTPEQQAAYNNTAQAINEMYTTHIGLDPTGSSSDTDQFGESSFEKTAEGDNTMGLIVSMLDKRYSSVEALNSSFSVYKELRGKTLHQSIDGIWEYAKDSVLTILAGAAGMISASLAKKILGVTSKEQLKTILQEHPQIADKYDEALRKYLKVISYFHYKKQQLPGAIARQHLLNTDTTFATLTEEQQTDKIDELLHNNEFVTTTIEPIVQQYNDAPLLTKEGKNGAIQLLTTYNILDGKIIPADQKKLEKITKTHEKMINKTQEGDVFLSMQESLQSNDQAHAKEQFTNLQKNLETHATTQGRASRRSAYMPLLTMFDTDAQTQKTLYNKCGFDEIAGIHLQSLQTLSNKDPLTETDIQKAKQIVNDYFVAVKELELTHIGVLGIFEENGEIMVDIGNTFVQTGESLIQGIRLSFNKDLISGEILAGLGKSLQGLAMLGGAGVTASIITYPLRVAVYPIRVARNLSNLLPPPKFPTSSGAKALWKIGKRTVKKGAQLAPRSSVVRMRGVAETYRGNPGLFRADLASGKLSLDEGVKIARKYRDSTDFMLNAQRLRTEDDLLRRAFGLSDQGHIDLLKANRNAPRRSSIMQQEFVGQRYKPRQRLQSAHRDRRFNPADLQNYTKLYQQVHNQPTGSAKTFFLELFRHAKNDTPIHHLLSETNHVKSLENLAIQGVDLTSLAKTRGTQGLPPGNHLQLLEEVIKIGKQNNKITNVATATNNIVHRRSQINKEAKNGAEVRQRIDKNLPLDLNKTRLERAWLGTKTVLQELTKRFESILKNPRLTNAYKQQVTNLINGCKKAGAQLNSATLQQTQQRLQSGRLGKLPSGLQAFRSSFSGGKGLRLLGSVLGKILIVGGLGLSIMDLKASQAERDAYDLDNPEKKQALADEASLKKGLVITEGAMVTARGATALFSAATGANVVPFAGQIASAVLFTTGVVFVGVDSYYETKQERTKNEQDFFVEANDIKLATKQNIISAIAYEAGQTRSVPQLINNIGSGVYFPFLKTGVQLERSQYIQYAIKTLIALDELENNAPLRQQRIDQLQTNDSLTARPKELDLIKEKRYAGLVTLYGDPPLDGKTTEHHDGITTLSRRIHASRWFAETASTEQPDRSKREKKIATDARYAKLKQQFDGYHADLLLYRHNSDQISSRCAGEANEIQLGENIAYFKEFMSYQKYLSRGAPTKTDKRSPDHSKYVFHDTAKPIDESTVDMQAIVRFFGNREIKPTPASSSPAWTPEQLENERHLSGNIGQQVLYRLCTEIHGYVGPNKLREDAMNKKGGLLGFLTARMTASGLSTTHITGIYYDPASDCLYRNTVRGRDQKLFPATPESLNNTDNIQALATSLDSTHLFTTKTGLGKQTLNKELTDRAKRIVREELRRRSPEGKKQVQAQLASFRQHHGTETPLPAELACRAHRAGVEIQKEGSVV